jgi:hypothetical protein
MNSVMSFETGTIFLKAGALAPASLFLRPDSLMNGWGVLANSHAVVDRQMRDEGWTFFFLAGEMKATTFRFDREKALATGLRRLAEMTKALRCNSYEISRVTHKLFLGVSRVSVSCHARHLQQGHLFYSE